MTAADTARQDPRQRLCRLFFERSFREGDFVLASGVRSRFYVDCRTTTMHGEGQALLGVVGLEAIRTAGLDPDAVGGLTMGADPIAYAIAGESWRQGQPLNAFSVRKQAKQHGRGRRIEGCLEPGNRVVVVEDVITSGGSALLACEAIREAGGKILAVLAAVDRQEGGREKLEAAGLTVHSLFTIEDLRGC